MDQAPRPNQPPAGDAAARPGSRKRGWLRRTAEAVLPAGMAERLRGRWRRLRNYHGAPLPPFYSGREALRGTAGLLARPLNVLQLLLFAALVGAFVWQASVHWEVVIDDSYITFRFVDMFAQGHGWVFNPEGPRVEGFTNFLWAVLLVVPHWLGWDLLFVAKWMGLLSAVAAMAAAWGLAAAVRWRNDLFNLLAPGLLAVNTWFSHWALMGMETQLQVALLTACYARFEVERRDARRWQVSPWLAVGAVLARVDSLFYLLPLCLYGLWLLGRGRWPWGRFRRALLIVLIPTALFWGWRWMYFGDVLPNTYYAKQRHVQTEHRPRAMEQFWRFYIAQPVAEEKPMVRGWLPDDAGSTVGKLADRVTGNLPGTGRPSLLWVNLWVLGGSLLVLGAGASLLWRGPPVGLPRWEAVAGLVFLPWLANVYYVWHVNGDWMPSFRFFQVVLPFIGVAVAAGFGSVGPLVRLWREPGPWGGWIAVGTFAVALWLVAGAAREHWRTQAAWVFGPGHAFVTERPGGWWHPQAVAESYGRGFLAPLETVSDHLLLNTRDDSWIYTGDIGQPLWFATHLSLYDADGLTDPMLGHAPSARGRLPTEHEHYERLVAEEPEPPNRPRRRELRRRAAREYHKAFAERSAAVLMEQRRPEYIVLFVLHEDGNPAAPGRAYPEVSALMYEHPALEEEYEHAGAFLKTTDVYNHFYRRADVPAGVPAEKRVERILRTIERNPRMPYLYALLVQQHWMLPEEGAEETRERLDAAAREGLRRWVSDPAAREIAYHFHALGEGDFVREVVAEELERNPANLHASYLLSQVHRWENDWAGALEVLEEAIEHRQPGRHEILYYMAALAESQANYSRASELHGLAVQSAPHDAEAWYRFGGIHARLFETLPLDEEGAGGFLEATRMGYETAMEIDPERFGWLSDMIARIDAWPEDPEEMLPETARPGPPALPEGIEAPEPHHVPPPPPPMEPDDETEYQ